MITRYDHINLYNILDDGPKSHEHSEFVGLTLNVPGFMPTIISLHLLDILPRGGVKARSISLYIKS